MVLKKVKGGMHWEEMIVRNLCRWKTGRVWWTTDVVLELSYFAAEHICMQGRRHWECDTKSMGVAKNWRFDLYCCAMSVKSHSFRLAYFWHHSNPAGLQSVSVVKSASRECTQDCCCTTQETEFFNNRMVLKKKKYGGILHKQNGSEKRKGGNARRRNDRQKSV